MIASLSGTVRNTAARIVSLPENDFAGALNGALRELLPSFYIASGAIRGSAGSETALFEAILSTAPIVSALAEADSVACADYVCHTLSEGKLREGCARIAQAGSLVKAPPPRDGQSKRHESSHTGPVAAFATVC